MLLESWYRDFGFLDRESKDRECFIKVAEASGGVPDNRPG